MCCHDSKRNTIECVHVFVVCGNVSVGGLLRLDISIDIIVLCQQPVREGRGTDLYVSGDVAAGGLFA